MIGVCFAVILMTSSPDPTSRYCGSRFFLDSRLEYESLEPLIDFLAFLIQKLCQKKNYQPETLECQSNPLKSRTVA